MKKRLVFSTSLLFAVALIAAPAMAQVCGPTYNSSYAPSYTPSYDSYAPSYDSAYAQPYAPVGCPQYTTGQWIWTGAAWSWCPANGYVPVGEPALVGYYGLGAPLPPPTIAVAPTYFQSTNPGVDLALGLAALAFMPQQTYFAYSPGYGYAYAPPYYFGNAAYVTNPAYVTTPYVATTVYNRTFVNRRFVNRRIVSRRIVNRRVANRTFVNRRIVGTRVFAPRRRIAVNRSPVRFERASRMSFRQARPMFRTRMATAPRRGRPPH